MEDFKEVAEILTQEATKEWAGSEHSEGVYWWVRLGDVAKYEKFDTVEEAKGHVEKATGKPFSEAHWITKYGFTLGPTGGYISFFEGDEAAQPTERYLYGKVDRETHPMEYVTITDPGKTTFKVGEVVSREAFDKENERVKKLGEKPATGR